MARDQDCVHLQGRASILLVSMRDMEGVRRWRMVIKGLRIFERVRGNQISKTKGGLIPKLELLHPKRVEWSFYHLHRVAKFWKVVSRVERSLYRSH